MLQTSQSRWARRVVSMGASLVVLIGACVALFVSVQSTPVSHAAQAGPFSTRGVVCSPWQASYVSTTNLDTALPYQARSDLDLGNWGISCPRTYVWGWTNGAHPTGQASWTVQVPHGSTTIDCEIDVFIPDRYAGGPNVPYEISASEGPDISNARFKDLADTTRDQEQFIGWTSLGNVEVPAGFNQLEISLTDQGTWGWEIAAASLRYSCSWR